jgi:anti-anti-sigma factor
VLSTCEVTIRHLNATAVLTLDGELNSSASTVLLPAYEKAVADVDPPTVVLDFTGVDYINSTGIALVVGVLARARAEGRALVATGLTEHYREIFTITRLSDYLLMYPDVETALASPAGA